MFPTCATFVAHVGCNGTMLGNAWEHLGTNPHVLRMGASVFPSNPNGRKTFPKACASFPKACAR